METIKVTTRQKEGGKGSPSPLQHQFQIENISGYGLKLAATLTTMSLTSTHLSAQQYNTHQEQYQAFHQSEKLLRTKQKKKNEKITTIIITIMIIIIIIIALKGAILDFYNLLTVPWSVSNTYAQVAMAQSCANHMQHIERLLCGNLLCHVVGRDGVEITFILAFFFYWLKPLNDEGGKEAGVSGENPWWWASENAKC